MNLNDGILRPAEDRSSEAGSGKGTTFSRVARDIKKI